MKPYLLFQNRDFYPKWGMLQKSPLPDRWREREYDSYWQSLPEVKRMVIQDLELDILFQAMAREDPFILEVVKNVILTGVSDISTIIYRQNILKDCIQNQEIIRNVYEIASDTLLKYYKATSWYSGKSANSVRSTSIRSLELFIEMLVALRDIAQEHAQRFESAGFKTLFTTISTECTDEYLTEVRERLKALKLENGILISVRLGKGNKGTDYALQEFRGLKRMSWIHRILAKEEPGEYSFTIADRDISGFKALGEIQEKSVNKIANTLLQASEHLAHFFAALKTELAFYIGCLQLRETLMQKGQPVCFPVPYEVGTRNLSFQDLYDVCLSLRLEEPVIGNDANAAEKDLVIITGANRGGKSTFLRSIGQAELLLQSGCMVPAASYSSDVCIELFTHFKREEDHSMKSGKFDEELGRMSRIIDGMRPNSLILLNESFAATNEREGSEISKQIVNALLDKRIKVICVTHLYEFSKALYEEGRETALFLRAERKPDGKRTYKVREGMPLQTSYGEDLYNRIFCRSVTPNTKNESVGIS